MKTHLLLAVAVVPLFLAGCGANTTAEVSTAMITTLPSRGEPKTSPASSPSTSPDWSFARRSTPPKAIAAADTTT